MVVPVHAESAFEGTGISCDAVEISGLEIDAKSHAARCARDNGVEVRLREQMIPERLNWARSGSSGRKAASAISRAKRTNSRERWLGENTKSCPS